MSQSVNLHSNQATRLRVNQTSKNVLFTPSDKVIISRFWVLVHWHCFVAWKTTGERGKYARQGPLDTRDDVADQVSPHRVVCWGMRRPIR